MSLEQVVFSALSPLVGGRVHAVTIPQEPKTPITPAIVFSFSGNTVTTDVCGAGSDEEADTRVTVDIYSTTFDSARALRLQVLAAMALLSPPMVWQGDNPAQAYDIDLKLHRCSLDFIQFPSSA